MTEREDIEETISRLGLYIDSKEWEKLHEVLGDEVQLDYRSLFGGSVQTMHRTEVISSWKSLLGSVKATQHLIANMLVTTSENDLATCTANVRALHVRPNNMGDSLWIVGGRYDIKLSKVEGKWKISGIKLTTQWTSGNPQVLGQQSSSSGQHDR